MCIRERAEELGPLLASEDLLVARRARRAIPALNEVPASYEAPLRKSIAAILKTIEEYTRTFDKSDPDLLGAQLLSRDYSDWQQAWERLTDHRKLPVPDQVKAIEAEAAKIEDPSDFVDIRNRSRDFLKSQEGDGH